MLSAAGYRVVGVTFDLFPAPDLRGVALLLDGREIRFAIPTDPTSPDPAVIGQPQKVRVA